MAFTKVTLSGAVDTIKEAFTRFNTFIDDLLSTDNGKGASQVGVEDAAGNFTGTNVEAVLLEEFTNNASAKALADVFNQDTTTTSGLSFGYKGGLIRYGTTVTTVAAGTIALTDDATNYVEIDTSGVVSRNTTSFSFGKTPIWQVTTASGAITLATDKRGFFLAGELSVASMGTSGQILTSNGTGTAASFQDISGLARPNLLINGAMQHAERRTSASPITWDATTTPANNDDTYLIDRWILLSDGNDIVDVSQQTGGGTSGKDYYLKLDIETVQKKFGIFQVIENKNCIPILGGSEVVSVSFEAKVSDITNLSDIRCMVVSWDSTADTVTSDIISAWGAEGVNPTLAANWTAENTAANLSVTGSWARYTIDNIAIDTSGTTNVGIFIWQNNVATADTLGDTFDITNIKLEKGASNTDYPEEKIEDTINACRRYCYRDVMAASAVKWTYVGHAISTSHALLNVQHPVTMRTSVTASRSATLSEWRLWSAGGDSGAPTVFAAATSLGDTTNHYTWDITATGTPLTDGDGVSLQFGDINAWIQYEAEL